MPISWFWFYSYFGRRQDILLGGQLGGEDILLGGQLPPKPLRSYATAPYPFSPGLKVTPLLTYQTVSPEYEFHCHPSSKTVSNQWLLIYLLGRIMPYYQNNILYHASEIGNLQQDKASGNVMWTPLSTQNIYSFVKFFHKTMAFHSDFNLNHIERNVVNIRSYKVYYVASQYSTREKTVFG